jgi:hypothetical protein
MPIAVSPGHARPWMLKLCVFLETRSFAIPYLWVSATLFMAPPMQARGRRLEPRLSRGPVGGQAEMQRRESRRRPACCLGDNCRYFVLYGPVGSSQVRLGGDCGESGLVRCSCGLWNDRENDQLSKRRGGGGLRRQRRVEHSMSPHQGDLPGAGAGASPAWVGRSWPCTLGLVVQRTNRMVSGYR